VTLTGSCNAGTTKTPKPQNPKTPSKENYIFRNVMFK
jgi:hypothetical protein